MPNCNFVGLWSLSHTKMWFLKIVFLITSLLLCIIVRVHCSDHKGRILTNEELVKLSSMTRTEDMKIHLNNIINPRVIGTSGHDSVKEYLISEMENLGWDVEQDIFTAPTPLGEKEFSNIVAKLDPSAPKHLVLACHYDSKLMDNFVGAIDSGVPCAMMLHLASVLSQQLQQTKIDGKHLSLQFIFFDGEEAFVEWSSEDSLYGSKHLAQKLENTPVEDGNKNALSKIDLFVLLDLLGAPAPTFYQPFTSMEEVKVYRQMMAGEWRLAKEKLLVNHRKYYFQPMYNFMHIEDDHVPFMQRGVPVLHIMSLPVPPEWHTERDNMELLDFDTIGNLNKILHLFVAEYLELNI